MSAVLETAPIPAPLSPIPGVNLLLLGGAGTGKTSIIRTWIEAGITPMSLFVEPGFEVISDIPCPKQHWVYIPPVSPSFADLLDSAKKINTFDFKQLTNLGDINRSKYQEFYKVLLACNDFKCDRCGKSFGPVDKWGTDKVFFLDSLSGLSTMAMNLVVGSKPVKAIGEWGVAMDNLERFIQKLCFDKRSHFVLTAHSEREVDEISGGSMVMPGTLGKKLAPKLPRYFSDVVLARRIGDKFTWSTTAFGVDLKARNLPFSDEIAPSAVQIIANWKLHGGIIEVPQ